MKMNTTPASSNITDQSDSECGDIIQPIFNSQYFFILHLVVILIGVPLNAFSLFVSCQHIKQKNELGVYLFSLALSDLCFIAGLPIWMDFILNDFWRHGKTMCTVFAFLLFTNYYTSAMLLSCIALDRYFAVVHPLNFPFFRTPSTAAVVSAAVLTFTIIFNAITIFPSKIYDEECEICLDILPMPESQKTVHIARFFVGFLLPAVVVIFCYWRICMEVCTNQATGLPERRRVFKLLGSVLFSLCLCFGPIHISLLLRAILKDYKQQDWLYHFYKVGVFLSFLNCLADPLLYCFITRTGYTSFTQAILRFQSKDSDKEFNI